MRKRILITTVGLFGLAASVAMSSSTVFADVAPAAQRAEVGIQGIGQGVSVLPGYVQIDMKPIPGTDAPNTGLARNGDNIAAICYLPDNHGVKWVLSINRTGRAGQQYSNTVGFIPWSLLDRSIDLNPCWYFNRRGLINDGLVQVDMKPIAGTDAPNTGLALHNDWLTLICRMPDNRGMEWLLVLDRYGHAGQQYADTTGYVPTWTVGGNQGVSECGTT